MPNYVIPIKITSYGYLFMQGDSKEAVVEKLASTHKKHWKEHFKESTSFYKVHYDRVKEYNETSEEDPNDWFSPLNGLETEQTVDANLDNANLDQPANAEKPEENSND